MKCWQIGTSEQVPTLQTSTEWKASGRLAVTQVSSGDLQGWLLKSAQCSAQRLLPVRARLEALAGPLGTHNSVIFGGVA